MKELRIKVNPHAKYLYIESEGEDFYAFLSDSKFKGGYKDITVEDLDEDCNLNRFSNSSGFVKVRIELSKLIEIVPEF